MTPTFFKILAEFRKWLKLNHSKKSELVVGLYKVKSSNKSITWSESVDEALCFGWIDGVRKSIDHESYCIRFTPRKATSIWSAVNITKIEVLTEKDLMQEAGIKAWKKRTESKSKIYSYENEAKVLSKEFADQFKANKKAWSFFEKQAPSYKKKMIFRIMSAKKESTRESRFQKLLAASKNDKRVD